MDFQKGSIKKTAGQRKKHYTQLTNEDYKVLRNKLAIVRQQWLRRGITLSYHLQDKMMKGETTFSLDEAMKCIMYGQIIEYNTTDTDKRVLLRSTQTISHEGKLVNQCIVVSLKTFRVVTSFLNYADDNHTSINLDRYDETLEVK
nr:MAG TPA: hypothetical protein [Caudoviricetes sp.]